MSLKMQILPVKEKYLCVPLSDSFCL